MPASLDHQERMLRHLEQATATVWKFEWPNQLLSGFAEIAMPRGAEVIHADEQFGRICIWARVDPKAPTTPRKFALCVTGGPAPVTQEGRFIASLLLNDGAFVVHLFEQP